MKTSGLRVCLAAASLFDPEVLATYAALLVALMGGGLAIYLTYRWYRTVRQPSSSRNEDLAQLERALEIAEDLEPRERDQLRAALERQRQNEPRGSGDGQST
jgi:hypothetical protein